MGHIRLGRLPRTTKWKHVINALESEEASFSGLLSSTSKASKDILTESYNLEGLTHCFWLFTNIAQASRKKDFIQALDKLGIDVSGNDSGLKILKKIYDFASSEINNKTQSKNTILNQIALESFKSAIHNTISRESASLFGWTPETIQQAFKKYSTSTQVAYLSRELFGNYINKAFSYVLEKELANSIGADTKFRNSADIQEFNNRLTTYCRETSKIVEQFSGGWYGKHGFIGDLKDKEKARRFTNHAITKLLSEVSLAEE